MTPQKPKLRKREIAFAVAAGVLAAGGASLFILEGTEVAEWGGEADAAIAGPSQVTYDVGPFEEISTSGPQDVVITFGETLSVRSEGSAQALSLLDAVVEDGRLSIGPRNGFNWGNWRRLEGATFYVTVPRLDAIAVAGSGDIRIDRVIGDRFSGTIAGASEVNIGRLEVDEADLSINGSGSIVAAGTAREARISIGGSGEVGAGALRSETASVSIGGSGDVELSVEDEARISIMGSGDVDISGPARCSVTRMGSGEVTCGGVDIEPR